MTCAKATRSASMLAVLCLSSASFAQTSGSWLGEERGPFETGSVEETWSYLERSESAANTSERILTIRYWYPAALRGNERRAVYAAGIGDYDRPTRDSWGSAAARATHSYVDAPLSDAQERYAVILYSPGYGNPVFSGTAQTEFLASHGYVVVSIGHFGWDSRETYPGGYRIETTDAPAEEESGQSEQAASDESLTPIERYRKAGRDPSLRSIYALGLQDIRFVIDELETIDASSGSRFSRRLDMSRIGGLGFSIGGSNYLQATIEEPRIAAAANMDGGVNGLPVLTQGARKPILLVQSSDSYPSVDNGPADAGMEELFVEVQRETWQMLRLSTDQWYKAKIQGTDHPHFSDAYLIAPPPEHMIDPRRAHYLMNRLTLEFFDRHLRASDETPLLNHEETFEDLRLVTRLDE